MSEKINKEKTKIAYFSMEIAIENAIKSYAGGLGVLSGDTLKSAADLKIPLLGLTLLNNQGYFKQTINKKGEQIEKADNYNYRGLKRQVANTFIYIGTDKVKLRAWEYKIRGCTGHIVPLYFLDTDIEGNKVEYRRLTGTLYGGDKKYRLCQEIILGRGGVKLLPILGYKNISKYHLNEGHAALSTIELLSQHKNHSFKLTKKKYEQIIEEIRKKCIFTTHTPVKAGHDIFDVSLVKKLQTDFPFKIKDLIKNNELNMSHLAMHFSSYINGVARSHQKVSAKMFPGHNIAAITNGVHSRTWTADEFKKLYDKYIPGWRECSLSLRNAFSIPPAEIWQAHQKTKKNLLDFIYQSQKEKLDLKVFTIGFARRFTGYKRSNLLFYDIDKLLQINKEVGKLQIIYAGKAHPSDQDGKNMIKNIIEIKEKYKNQIKIIFLENYDMKIAKLLIPGVDIWLNTPLPPNEASGTSGMKAAHNGVPHFSTLDGWWIEGFINRKTGWAIGKRRSTLDPQELNKSDAADLYYRLEYRILPRYYNTPNRWRETMRHTIAVNASYFNTERMMQQYVQGAYL
jgi:glycogen phosphorylase